MPFSLEKALIQLASPYKTTEAYETFKNLKPNRDKHYFWPTSVEYVIKYKNAILRR